MLGISFHSKNQPTGNENTISMWPRWPFIWVSAQAQ